MTLSRPLRRLSSGFLSFLMLSSTLFPGIARAQAAQASSEELMRSLQEFFADMQTLREALPRADFDPAALLREIGTNPQTLRDWVQQNTRWVPYHGHLRGPEALMSDRSGNSLDRAVLLAHLLRLAGHEPLLETANVDADWIREHLLPQSGARPVSALPDYTPPDEHGQEAALASLSQLIAQQQQLSEKIAARLHRQTPMLAGAFPEQIQPLPEAPLSPGAHWWVRINLEGESLRLDPAGAPALAAMEAFARDQLPAGQQQQLTVEVRVEQFKDGAVHEHIALREAFSVADLGMKSMTLGFHSSDIELDLAQIQSDREGLPAKLRRQLENASTWVPVLQVGDVVYSEEGFTATGELNADHKGGATAQALGQATSLLGGLGMAAPKDSGILTGVFVDVVWSGPGAEPHRERRSFYDLPGKALRHQDGGWTPERDLSQAQKISRGLAMTSRMDLLVQNGDLTRAAAVDIMAAHMLRNRIGLLGAMHYSLREDWEKVQSAAQKISPFPDQLYLWALLRMEHNADRAKIHLARPSLVARFHELRFDPEGGEVLRRMSLDILDNPTHAMGTARETRSLRLRQSLLDAIVEDLVLESPNAGIANASRLLETRPMEGWTRIETAEALQAFPTPPEIRPALVAALEENRVLLLPVLPPDLPANEAVWWELHPETGHVTARLGPDARGGVTAEQMANIFLLAVNLIPVVIDFVLCLDNATFACVFCAVVAAGIAIGGLLVPGMNAALALKMSSIYLALGCLTASVI